jgi:hypothetical protein
VEQEKHEALMAVARALAGDEEQAILHRWAPEGSRLRGAQVADLLDMAEQHDTHVEVTDEFDSEHGGELPDVPGLIYAEIALIMASVPLTVTNVIKLLLRAGLMPRPESVITWEPYATPSGTGYTGCGKTFRYLVVLGPDHQARLCRWRQAHDNPLDDIREATWTSILVSTTDEGRNFAERYERGQDLPWAPAWSLGRGLRST